MKIYTLILVCLGLFISSLAFGQTKSPKGASVYIISPAHGEVVSNPVTVLFGLKGMGVAPAKSRKEKTGHHHLLIDAKQLPPLDKPIPTDDVHRHYGGGQTEVTLTLSPGKHTLQLLFADRNHTPHDPIVISKKIEITVK